LPLGDRGLPRCPQKRFGRIAGRTEVAQQKCQGKRCVQVGRIGGQDLVEHPARAGELAVHAVGVAEPVTHIPLGRGELLGALQQGQSLFRPAFAQHGGALARQLAPVLLG
jgi:hypothetical protein